MTDSEFNHWHIVYALPIWTLATWILLLVLAWCIVGMKKKIDRLADKIDECAGKQDAYFGLPRLDVEAVRIRDMEVRAIRNDELDEQEKRAKGEAV